ncbi:MAG TPA: ferrous iron transport protein A [Peptococcaceae bacterium]|nr:ferrous iron transport protein A [Peptococcaceae bacterium]
MDKSKQVVPLSQLAVGHTAQIVGLELKGLLRRRVQDLGLIPGTTVECIRRGPTGDPTAYAVRGTTVALRKEDANLINVYPI